jgi:hypothetical protein
MKKFEVFSNAIFMGQKNSIVFHVNVTIFVKLVYTFVAFIMKIIKPIC